jgi:hypothetical protein
MAKLTAFATAVENRHSQRQSMLKNSACSPEDCWLMGKTQDTIALGCGVAVVLCQLRLEQQNEPWSRRQGGIVERTVCTVWAVGPGSM